MSNDKKDGKEKEGSFDPGCIVDIYDKLSGNNYALRAFANLLGNSDLIDFATQFPTNVHRERNFKAETLRLGLSQIIDSYLANQEKIFEEYLDQYEKSDICLMKWAKSAIDMMDQGAFATKGDAIHMLREAAETLDIVINRGGELKEKAEELKETCMVYLRPMTEKTKE